MAGGDLLYIFAFIILPTAVLVSCIWALIMLRKGVLLPERPVVTRELRDVPDSEEDVPLDATNLVEETGEHLVVEPVTTIRTPAPVATTAAAVAPVSRLSQPPASTDAVAAPVPRDEPPVVEQTQELTALSPDAEPVANPQRRETVSPAEGAAIAPVAALDDAYPALPDAETPDLLMVPLDDVSSGFSPERGDPERRETTGPAADQPQAPPASATTPRRPVRRVVQRRPTEAEPSRPRPRTGQRRSARRVEE
jgi:hypothetical protein